MGNRQRDAQALGKAKNDNKAERIEAREGNLVNLATSMPSETDAVALPPPHELPEQPVCGKTTGLKDRERVREGGAVRCCFLHTLAGPAANQPSRPIRAGFLTGKISYPDPKDCDLEGVWKLFFFMTF